MSVCACARIVHVFCNLSCLNGQQGSEVVVKEKSVSVILLAGGKGKRMGVSRFNSARVVKNYVVDEDL